MNCQQVSSKDLPLSTYTEAYWKIDLHNLLHFLQLRMDSHAQLEIRTYANIIGHEIVAKLFPVTWQAFLDYRLNAMTLSAMEQQLLVKYFDHQGTFTPSLETMTELAKNLNMSKREVAAFWEKFQVILWGR